MNIYIRFCVECGEGYDIGTEYDFCSKCRREKEVKNEGRGNFRKNAQ